MSPMPSPGSPVPRNTDTSYLKGWLNPPYRKEEVIAALRELQPPVLMREVASHTGLPRWVCSRVLTRLVRQGIATRFKVRISYRLTGGRGKLDIPGGKTMNVWAYTLVAGE
jgi:DNA-binding Lrp family transcriptional regulator